MPVHSGTHLRRAGLDSIIFCIQMSQKDRRMKAFLALLASALLTLLPLSAQDTSLPDAEHSSWDVYVRQSIDEPVLTDLIFLNVLTGETVIVSIAGERFTLLEGGVLFLDTDEGKLKVATPDGTIRVQAFITALDSAYRVDWVLSDDGQFIAWTVTDKATDNSLSTRTMVADVKGTEIREILADGPRTDIRVLPVAFSADNQDLIMDAHPDGLDEYLPYLHYAGLFAIDLDNGTLKTLPGESPCYCAAGFGDNILLRLPPSVVSGGVDVIVTDVDTGETRQIPALALEGFGLAGRAIVNDDESLAIYALSAVYRYGLSDEEIRTVFVLVNLESDRQSIVSNPLVGTARILEWTGDGSVVRFTNPGLGGTWKLNLSDLHVTQVASATFLGRVKGA